jgi:hypothetical protein
VGDYNLYAEYGGSAVYDGSNDSDTLGISYLFVGFGQPINADGTSIFGGRVIPIKIKLVDANGDPVTGATPTVWLTSYDKDLGLGGDWEQVSSVSKADTGNIMRYVPEDRQYIYNWDATDLPNGTYGVVVNLGDSAACRAENPYAIIYRRQARWRKEVRTGTGEWRRCGEEIDRERLAAIPEAATCLRCQEQIEQGQEPGGGGEGRGEERRQPERRS